MDVDGHDNPPPEKSPSPEPVTGRGARVKRPTWKLLQLLPQPPAAVPELQVTEPDPDATPPPEPTTFVWESVKTAMNSFGLYREYPRVPTHDPDSTLSLDDLSDVPKALPASTSTSSATGIPIPSRDGGDGTNPYYPFPNSTAYGITNWMWSGSALKSIAEVTRLVEFLKSPDFNPNDLACFNLAKETEHLDKLSRGSAEKGPAGDGWSQIAVHIKVPDGKPHSVTSPSPLYTVPGLFLRPLSEVLRSAIADTTSRRFHFTPFKQFHKSHPDAVPTRVYDEIYSSDAMIDEYEKLQSQPAEPECTLERVVLALMFWSDSTHLASFGNAALWPLYLFFGNQSKWVRGKPNSGACHHLAYIPKVSLSHEQWDIILTIAIAPRSVSRLLYQVNGQRAVCRYSYPLPPRVDARRLGKDPGPRIYGGVRAWNCSRVS
ncbi:hypothetical protein B0H16DRAFT_1328148 [Mycena metata]|uniref:Uncharacterized protein n=1 Tax=Mycena metata TaxID=1033252 RepID=A0AAD7I2C9_9AGAR|nr:hypothetical protein B0H16DRAFT_1328148 [Mycena metata]